jgi:hypothetical protein
MNKKLLTIPTLIIATAIATFGLSTKASADMINAHVGLGIANGPALSMQADTTMNGGPSNGQWQQHGMPGVFGTVTAVSGDTITVSSKGFGQNTTTTTYTINASGATVMKDNAASSVSAIAVGDTIMAQGTVSGTTVTATKINDGMMMRGMPGSNGGASMPGNIPQGNGQPIIGGTVTAVSGDTVTITNKGTTPYTIDVTNAKITKNGTTASASNIAVGDNVVAQGTINGTSVTAVTLTDSMNTTSGTSSTAHKGILGAIGGFFSKLFGF